MIKKAIVFMIYAVTCTFIVAFGLLFMLVVGLFLFHSGDISRRTSIQGNYEMSVFTVDDCFSATVHRSDESEDCRESIYRIGTQGKYIYWQAGSDTLYCIDTEAKSQERIEQLPEGLELMDPITFWNKLRGLPTPPAACR